MSLNEPKASVNKRIARAILLFQTTGLATLSLAQTTPAPRPAGGAARPDSGEIVTREEFSVSASPTHSGILIRSAFIDHLLSKTRFLQLTA